MKTLTDLLNLVTQEIELNTQGYMVNFAFDINTKHNWISFSKISPVFSETEKYTDSDGIERAKEIEKKTEVIVDRMDLTDKGEIQQAYWTIYNKGRSKVWSS